MWLRYLPSQQIKAMNDRNKKWGNYPPQPYTFQRSSLYTSFHNLLKHNVLLGNW